MASHLPAWVEVVRSLLVTALVLAAFIYVADRFTDLSESESICRRTIQRNFNVTRARARQLIEAEKAARRW